MAPYTFFSSACTFALFFRGLRGLAAPVWPKTKLSGRKSCPNGPARTESYLNFLQIYYGARARVHPSRHDKKKSVSRRSRQELSNATMNTAIRLDIDENGSFEVRHVILPITCRQSRRSDRCPYSLQPEQANDGPWCPARDPSRWRGARSGHQWPRCSTSTFSLPVSF